MGGSNWATTANSGAPTVGTPGVNGLGQTISGEPPKKGGILAALRRSPLVGADIDLTRLREEGRKVDI